ncbi:MAG: hypothetical protein WBD31_25190, partial [Rubripirellula sp.]
MSINKAALTDRTNLLTATRAEIVGPSMPSERSRIVTVVEDSISLGDTEGPVFIEDAQNNQQEVVYFSRESPTRKYGAGVLHPQIDQHDVEVEPDDTVGFTPDEEKTEIEGVEASSTDDEEERVADVGDRENVDPEAGAEPEPLREPTFKTSSMGISFCVHLPDESGVRVQLPRK